MRRQTQYFSRKSKNSSVQWKCFDLSDLSCGPSRVPELHAGHCCLHVAPFTHTLDECEMLRKCYSDLSQRNARETFMEKWLWAFVSASTDHNGRLVSPPVTKLSLQPLEIVFTSAAKCARCLPQLFQKRVCVERGAGVVSKHRRVTGSGIALSMTERGFFFFFLRPVWPSPWYCQRLSLMPLKAPGCHKYRLR